MHIVERLRTTFIALLLVSLALDVSATTASPEPKPKIAAAPSKAAPKRKSLPTSTNKADVRSAAFIIVDEHSEDELLAKQADKAMPIASITKLMTALVVLEADQPLDESIKITKEDRAVELGGRLVVGSSLTRGELLHLALMSSENRAANALGRHYPGGIPGLVEAMNAKAKALGMRSAHFTDATGLSNGNVASPRDLVKLVNATARIPLIREYSTDTDEVVKVGKHLVEYRNTNLLVRKPDWDVVVQKTGFTNAAGQCLVMKAIIEDRPVVMVLMNSFGKYTRVADAQRVRKWMQASTNILHAGTSVQAVR